MRLLGGPAWDVANERTSVLTSSPAVGNSSASKPLVSSDLGA